MKVEKTLENVSMKIVDNTLDKPKMLLSLIYCKISASEIQKSLEPKMNLVNNKPFHLELPQWVSTLRPIFLQNRQLSTSHFSGDQTAIQILKQRILQILMFHMFQLGTYSNEGDAERKC